MRKYFRNILQIFFLCLFVVLVAIGKTQVWMVVFVGSFLGAILLGRFYCGWLCPINTGIEWIDRIYKVLKIIRRPVPIWIKKPFIRYLILLLFLFMVITVFVTGIKIPVLPAMFFMGSLLSLLFVPAMWHRYLCPYGILLSFTGLFARKTYKVEISRCNKCGICTKVCPAEAVKREDLLAFPEIKSELCLECSACADACPKKTISYK